MKYRFLNKAAAVVMTVCAFVFSSCGEKPGEILYAPEVSVKTPEVGSTSGSMFVSVKCSGEWTLSVEYPGAEQDWASLSVDRGNGDKSNVTLSYKANTLEEKRSLSLVLVRKSDGETASCPVTQMAKGQTVDPTPGPNPENPVTSGIKADWLELPAMDNDKLEYYVHKFDFNGKTYRNYSFGWSQNDLVAIWLAYPLNKMYTNKTVSRSDAWAYDPILGPDRSPAPFGGYGDELARGHQVPSADRLCCYEANAQTFYGTNMTPQQNAHNEGIWGTLEGAVRNWANTSDTTYVVTGCVVDGYKRTTTDSDGKKIHVPVAYWKAVLRYHKASTISQWACAAFYTEHKDYGKNTNLKNVAMSIDALEEKLGIDFYVNLPAKVGEAKAKELEAQDPKSSNIWW